MASSFLKEVDVLGELSAGDLAISGLHFKISYSQIHDRRIRCHILAQTNRRKELIGFVRAAAPFTIKGAICRSSVVDETFFSDDAWPDGTFLEPSPNEVEQELELPIGEFQLGSARFRRKIRRRTARRRVIEFTMAARSARIWDGLIAWPNRPDSGQLCMNACPEFSVQASSVSFSSTSGKDGSGMAGFRTCAIKISTKLSQKIMNNDSFKQEATNLVDDLLLLLSFLCHSRNTWCKYTFWSSGLHENYIKGTSDGLYRQDDQSDYCLLTPVETKAFLDCALSRLRASRTEGRSLDAPMQLFIASHESRFLEERFVGLFFALERLVAQSGCSRAIVGSADFRIIRKSLKNSIRKVFDRDSDRKRLYARIRSAGNQNTFAEAVIQTAKRHGVAWADIRSQHDKASRVSFVDLRNNLVHPGKGGAPEPGDIWREYVRLRVFVERIILKMLGWEGRDRIPPDMKKVLRSDGGAQ